MNLRLSITFILIVIVATKLSSQISQGGRPWSFNNLSLKKAASYELPAFDYAKMLEEDVTQTKGKIKPYRYGKVHDVKLNPENSGTWQTLDNGDRIWQLHIKSPKAYSLSIISNKYKLEGNAKVYLYTPGNRQLIGSFTEKNNLENGYFSTVPLAGDEITIEMNLKAGEVYGDFEISGVVHDYKNILKAGFGSSGWCNINVNCSEGADWQDEKRSVVKIVFSGYLCSGAMINNTAQNGKPYLLTAEHCISSEGTASTAVFWFNYESPECEAMVNPEYQSINSSTLISTGDNLDFTLLELSSNPPVNYNVYYAGWNRGTSPATHTVTIHHPDGDIKKISLDNDPPTIDNYGSGYVTDSHWNIAEWDAGTTEGGSSGGPLFDQNHRIVGDLTGGDASCSYNFNDYYSRFDMSWDYHPEPAKHLKTWLDPLNLGVTTLDGFDPNDITTGLDARVSKINTPDGVFCGVEEIGPQVIVKNNGTTPITSFTINYQIDGGAVVSEQWSGNLESLQSITYTFSNAQIPIGRSVFKAFVSSPNGETDLKNSNDTMLRDFISEDMLSPFEIIGDEYVCAESLTSYFTSDVEGQYLWSVSGDGEITDGKNTWQDITVKWDKWGAKEVYLQVSNTCNTLQAPVYKVKVVEQAINVMFITNDDASQICWDIKDCKGNLIYQECGLPSNSFYSKTINLSAGCYSFNINPGTAFIESFLVSDFCGISTIIEGGSLIGPYSEEFSISTNGIPAEFNIYPNPVSEELAIEANLHEAYQDAGFTIYNIRGAVVVPYNKLDSRMLVNVSHLPRGLYILEISSPRGKFPRKFIKLK